MWVVTIAMRIARPAPGLIDRTWDAHVGTDPTSGLHAVAEALDIVGAGTPALLVCATVAILLGALRGWAWSAFVVAASLLSELDVLGMKVVAARARPDATFGVGTSFPSGHTTNAALLSVIVILLVPHLAIRIGAALYALAMAWSRTELHAHWATDVLAGLVIGTATAVLLHALWAALSARIVAAGGSHPVPSAATGSGVVRDSARVHRS